MTSDQMTLVEQTVEQIKPLLAGKPPPVQGAVLAELLALWISHHVIIPADDEEQRKVWDSLMEMHVEAVYELIEANAAMRKEVTH